jgi:hypothetical protein
MNLKKGHQGDIFVCVKDVDLISLHKSITVKDMKEETIEMDGGKLLLDALKLVIFGRHDRIPNH